VSLVRDGRFGGDDSEANARLIAAAPDLLEVVATYLSMETHIEDGVSPLIDMARVAYNKAVGE
jgi:hypothetical protein